AWANSSAGFPTVHNMFALPDGGVTRAHASTDQTDPERRLKSELSRNTPCGNDRSVGVRCFVTRDDPGSLTTSDCPPIPGGPTNVPSAARLPALSALPSCRRDRFSSRRHQMTGASFLTSNV